MIILHVEAPFGTFRKSFARSYAETYAVPPPATVYGMLLSLVGERFRTQHEGVGLALAFKRQPQIATTLRKLSRFKYGVASKQSKLGNAPDYIESLCGIEFLCWIDSSTEVAKPEKPLLEKRVQQAIQTPQTVDRYGIVCLGLSDDAVDTIDLVEQVSGHWLRLVPNNTGQMELPIWVDHVGALETKWNRFDIDESLVPIDDYPDTNAFVRIERTHDPS